MAKPLSEQFVHEVVISVLLQPLNVCNAGYTRPYCVSRQRCMASLSYLPPHTNMGGRPNSSFLIKLTHDEENTSPMKL